MTLILWLVWSDSIRPRRASKIVCWIRVVVFFVVGAMLIQSAARSHAIMSGDVLGFTIVAAVVAFVGAGYFYRRATLKIGKGGSDTGVALERRNVQDSTERN